MGSSVIFDILSATIIGGIILINLLKLNENVYQTEVYYNARCKFTG